LRDPVYYSSLLREKQNCSGIAIYLHLQLKTIMKEEQIMIELGNTLISLDLAEKAFCCDLQKCKGACCIEGDSGAPLLDSEIDILEKEHYRIKPYLTDKGAEAIEENGVFYIDTEHDKVTTLINGSACAYTITDEDGITKCAIEAAFLSGNCSLRKPISCYLYPVRINQYRTFDAVNYDEWSICKGARCKGSEIKLPVYKFLKEPLINKYGKDWYDELSGIFDQLQEEGQINPLT